MIPADGIRFLGCFGRCGAPDLQDISRNTGVQLRPLAMQGRDLVGIAETGASRDASDIPRLQISSDQQPSAQSWADVN